MQQRSVDIPGIPQGSNLSALLCALYYGNKDRHPDVQRLLKGKPGPTRRSSSSSSSSSSSCAKGGGCCSPGCSSPQLLPPTRTQEHQTQNEQQQQHQQQQQHHHQQPQQQQQQLPSLESFELLWEAPRLAAGAPGGPSCFIFCDPLLLEVSAGSSLRSCGRVSSSVQQQARNSCAAVQQQQQQQQQDGAQQAPQLTAAEFLRLLTQQQVWGPNVNVQKLRLEVDWSLWPSDQPAAAAAAATAAATATAVAAMRTPRMLPTVLASSAANSVRTAPTPAAATAATAATGTSRAPAAAATSSPSAAAAAAPPAATATPSSSSAAASPAAAATPPTAPPSSPPPSPSSASSPAAATAAAAAAAAAAGLCWAGMELKIPAANCRLECRAAHWRDTAQLALRDAAALRRRKGSSFISGMLERPVFGSLRAWLGSRVFVDLQLNSLCCSLRNTYLAVRLAFQRLLLALKRLLKEFAAFVNPKYLL
ncbi:hypothetical protein ETH_00040655, partial [Eimeria tenella]